MSPVPPATSSTWKAVAPSRRVEQGDEIVFPQPVHAPGHQVIHLVIAFGGLGEDLVHQALLFVLVHPAKAEGHVIVRLSVQPGAIIDQ